VIDGRDDESARRRAKTALQRVELSRPVRLALNDGIITSSRTVFDYGCGRGGDIRRLRNTGIECSGWDPVHQPAVAHAPADVVNLGYVINVIEDRTERAEVLRRAWTLARYVLVVAGRLEAESRLDQSVVSGDGVVTRTGSFQKLYHQDELRNWVQQTLDMSAIAAGPGVFYVFRHDSDRQDFLAARHQRAYVLPRGAVEHARYAAHETLFDPVLAFARKRGRIPSEDEVESAPDLALAFGTYKAAVRLLRRTVDEESWAAAERARIEDLLIYLGLSRFDARPQLTRLSVDVQRDIRAFFTSYKAACELADSLLFAAGDAATVERLCRKSAVGKITPTALYVHRSALSELSPVLRLYEGCGRGFLGQMEDANVIKLHHDKPAITYLEYPDFDTHPHPALTRATRVGLQTRSIDFRDYSHSRNPPILHRKEEMLSPQHPLFESFKAFTDKEVALGLFSSPEHIGTRDGWTRTLTEAGVAIRGNRLVKVTK
jgi:DNA phosphorothioation-associated putative methyltransferase